MYPRLTSNFRDPYSPSQVVVISCVPQCAESAMSVHNRAYSFDASAATRKKAIPYHWRCLRCCPRIVCVTATYTLAFRTAMLVLCMRPACSTIVRV
jgi:hypothetical protein